MEFFKSSTDIKGFKVFNWTFRIGTTKTTKIRNKMLHSMCSTLFRERNIPGKVGRIEKLRSNFPSV